MHTPLPLIGALAALCFGCNVVSPPPLVPQLAGTAPNTPGDVRLMLVVGVSGGIWVDGGFGGELRVESQVTEWATVGGGLAGGINLEHGGDEAAKGPGRHQHPRWLYAARTWGRFNPGALDWLALTAGAGFSGTDTGTVALTLDGSTLFGHPFHPSEQAPWRLTPYGGPVVALSIPLLQGQPIMKQSVSLGLGPDMATSSRFEPVPYSTTFFVGAQGGLAVDSPGAPAWTGALELLSLIGFSATDSATLVAIAMGQGARVHP
ncbi:hypothetical protein [Polyangium aurulentum]|uniref:hypothetical protein n=1 Tax=Polyangium aurulentum TaxID=2567896 RepID=UPI0010AE13BD|nr:hypothetical protein [Polyangium aurulentum]UQA56389.1 hypothetical protein E8A73_034490 [Polyangium aurulentum]